MTDAHISRKMSTDLKKNVEFIAEVLITDTLYGNEYN